jgi:hypothetical protein
VMTPDADRRDLYPRRAEAAAGDRAQIFVCVPVHRASCFC